MLDTNSSREPHILSEQRERNKNLKSTSKSSFSGDC
uniref:Uncharacterized protein n=1 Tax=Arundo donax TaxID=35708 RepID=A0A0A9T3Z9_ARUDO